MNTQTKNNMQVMQELNEEAVQMLGCEVVEIQLDEARSNRISVKLLVKIKGKRDLQKVTFYDLWHVKFDHKKHVAELFFGERTGVKFGCFCAFIKNVKYLLEVTNDSLCFELSDSIALDLLPIDEELRPDKMFNVKGTQS